jgi:hypothetical protein
MSGIFWLSQAILGTQHTAYCCCGRHCCRTAAVLDDQPISSMHGSCPCQTHPPFSPHIATLLLWPTLLLQGSRCNYQPISSMHCSCPCHTHAPSSLHTQTAGACHTTPSHTASVACAAAVASAAAVLQQHVQHPAKHQHELATYVATASMLAQLLEMDVVHLWCWCYGLRG